MAYSLDPIEAGCYEGTTCLINKLDIRDEKQLADLEAFITAAKTAELEERPINGQFDFEHYKAIHKYLFEDLYDWAGTVRKVDISKKGTRFIPFTEIEKTARFCFLRLKENNYFKDLDHNDYIDAIADFYDVTNMLHPFREGNGRTQRIFLTQLIRFAGHDISFADIDKDLLMIATVQAAQGVMDNLKLVLSESIVF